MTESEKMKEAQWYFATDAALIKQRMKAKKLCFSLNQTPPDNIGQRKGIIKQLMPDVKSPWIEPNFYCDYGFNIHAESGLFINHNVTILDGATVTVGKNVFIGPGTVIATTSHHMDVEQRAKGICRSLPITIGDDVWIGANVTIIGGANIEAGRVIGANSLVK
jgi:maltose O-acetyltransferase